MIKIRLEKWDRAVVMQVLEQSMEIMKELNDNPFKFGDLVLEYYSSPSLTKDTVYVRGTCEADDFEIARIIFTTNAERDEYYTRVLALFNAYNNRERDENHPGDNIFILK